MNVQDDQHDCIVPGLDEHLWTMSNILKLHTLKKNKQTGDILVQWIVATVDGKEDLECTGRVTPKKLPQLHPTPIASNSTVNPLQQERRGDAFPQPCPFTCPFGLPSGCKWLCCIANTWAAGTSGWPARRLDTGDRDEAKDTPNGSRLRNTQTGTQLAHAGILEGINSWVHVWMI